VRGRHPRVGVDAQPSATDRFYPIPTRTPARIRDDATPMCEKHTRAAHGTGFHTARARARGAATRARRDATPRRRRRWRRRRRRRRRR
jgi:hypothetical protein